MKAKTGRPTFQLDKKRLKSVREEAKLTQAEVARRAYALGKSPTTADTATKHYQKIERTGRTSRAMAKALAEVLNTTVNVLQGEAPDKGPSLIESLERQFRHQLETGASPALQEALAQDALAQRGDPDPDPVRAFAEQVAKRIEYMQLGPPGGELARLVELTGWTEAQLMEPMSIDGHWFVMSMIHGGRRSEIVLGVDQVQLWIQDSIRDFCPGFPRVFGTDCAITLREELPWLHVEVQHPSIPAMRNTFSFVRCTPTPWGLHWVNPSWRDRFWLDDSLLDWAFTHANFVVGFDGQAVPSDMRALRLLIARRSDGEHLAVVKGNLEELPDDVLDNFKRQGESHDVVVSWIAAGLWEAVEPLLHDGPAEQWQVQQSGTCIVIRRDASIRWEGPGRFVPVPSGEYVVQLVEQLGDGKFRRVPWRQSSAEKIAERLKQRLGEEAERNRVCLG
jgi:transcriptional regulator with XRE-family HTH domain